MKLSHLHESDREYRRLTQHPGEMSTDDHIRASNANLGRHDKEIDWAREAMAKIMDIAKTSKQGKIPAPQASQEISTIAKEITNRYKDYDFTHAPAELIHIVQAAQKDALRVQQYQDRQTFNNAGREDTTFQDGANADIRLHGPDQELTPTQNWKLGRNDPELEEELPATLRNRPYNQDHTRYCPKCSNKPSFFTTNLTRCGRCNQPTKPYNHSSQ